MAEPVRSKLSNHTYGGLDLLVRIEPYLSIRQIDEAYRRSHFQFAAARLVEYAAAHACFQKMQFSLAKFALQAEQKSVVEGRRVVEAILIEDQGSRNGAQLDQPVPIGRISSQSRNFQPHHHAGLAESHFADQLLKSIPTGSLVVSR
jgi:hypothetical protein